MKIDEGQKAKKERMEGMMRCKKERKGKKGNIYERKECEVRGKKRGMREGEEEMRQGQTRKQMRGQGKMTGQKERMKR